MSHNVLRITCEINLALRHERVMRRRGKDLFTHPRVRRHIKNPRHVKSFWHECPVGPAKPEFFPSTVPHAMKRNRFMQTLPSVTTQLRAPDQGLRPPRELRIWL